MEDLKNNSFDQVVTAKWEVLLPNLMGSSLDYFGSRQSNPLLSVQNFSGYPSMLNQMTTTQFAGQPDDQQANSYYDEKVARKRQKNREYREGCKKRKMETKEYLEALGRENEDLKKENESLKRENAFMNQTLESKAEEREQLRSNLRDMKFESEKQNIIAQILSSFLANPDALHLENQKPKDENVRLRKNVEMNDNTSVQLIKENSELQYENTVLRVQIDALCGKIANDNR